MTTKIYNKLPKEAKLVREEVFIKEQGFLSDDDEIDDIATHFVTFDNGEPIAACRIYPSENSCEYILGRLSVRSVCRGKGVGKIIYNEAENHIRKLGGKSIILQAQCRVKDFYLSLGFTEYGDVEYEEGCALIWMKKNL